MFNIMKMALLNTLRNKRRSILSEIMIIVGVVVILFSSSFLTSMAEVWRDALINADLGHFQIMKKGYKEKRLSYALDLAIQEVDSITTSLLEEPGIVGALKRISIGGLISTGENTSTFFGSGIDIESIPNVLPDIFNRLVDGKELSPTSEGEAVLGEGLAKSIDAKLGDVLLLATYDKYKAMNAVEVTLVGIVSLPDEVLNNRIVYTDYDTASSLVSFDNEATEIVVRTENLNLLKDVVGNIRDNYSEKYNVEFYEWEALAGSFRQGASIFAFTSMIISLIIYVIVLIGLANTILMSVFERFSEIGTLVAIGSSRMRVMFMFLMESTWLGIVGIIIGVLIHSGIIALVSDSGIPTSPPGANEPIMIYPSFDWGQVILTCILVIIVATIAAIYPSRVASKLNPIDAIRTV